MIPSAPASSTRAIKWYATSGTRTMVAMPAPRAARSVSRVRARSNALCSRSRMKKSKPSPARNSAKSPPAENNANVPLQYSPRRNRCFRGSVVFIFLVATPPPFRGGAGQQFRLPNQIESGQRHRFRGIHHAAEAERRSAGDRERRAVRAHLRRRDAKITMKRGHRMRDIAKIRAPGAIRRWQAVHLLPDEPHVILVGFGQNLVRLNRAERITFRGDFQTRAGREGGRPRAGRHLVLQFAQITAARGTDVK